MIRYYHRTAHGQGLQVYDEYSSGTWVYVEQPSEEEIDLLAEKYKLDRSLLEDAIDEDEMPRMEKEGAYTYIYTRDTFTNDALQIGTTPVLFVISPKLFMTIAHTKLSRLDHFTTEKVEYDTTDSLKMFLQVMDQIVDQYEVKLNSISRQIKSIRSRLRVEEIRNKDFIDFVVIEDVLNEFLSALTPTNAILQRLLLGKFIKLHEHDEDIIQDLILNNEQSIEGCKSSLKSIVNIREAYSTIMSNNLNQVMRLLTVLTVTLAVPTLISSMYGMNIPLPYDHSDKAFLVIIGVAAISATTLILVFKRRKWM